MTLRNVFFASILLKDRSFFTCDLQSKFSWELESKARRPQSRSVSFGELNSALETTAMRISDDDFFACIAATFIL